MIDIPIAFHRQFMRCSSGPRTNYEPVLRFFKDRKTYILDRTVRVREISIVQDTLAWYTDFIMVTCAIPTREFVRLVNDHVGMDVSLEMRPRDVRNDGVPSDDDDDGTFSFRGPVVIRNLKEVTLEMSKHQIDREDEYGGDLVTMELELVDRRMLEMRKQEMNTILRKATVEDAVHFVRSVLGIERLEMAPPDNTHVYEHIPIPPMTTMGNVAEYLQSSPGMGVYKEGLGWYYSQGVLHVYPQRSVKQRGPVVEFYNVGEGNMPDIDCNHLVDDAGNVFAVCSGDILFRASSQEKRENRKLNTVVADSNAIALDWTELNADDVPEVTDHIDTIDSGLNFGVRNEERTSDALFAFSHGNSFEHYTDAVNVLLNRMVVPWTRAVPFMIKPDRTLRLHGTCMITEGVEESENPHWTMDCVPEKMVFTYTPATSHDQPFLRCDGRIQVAVMTEEYQP